MDAKPIQVYSCGTPNGDKVHIYLEEAGIPYDAHTINIRVGEQFLPEFLAINPNNRIPAIVDPTGDNGKSLPVFESAAILIYLAEKNGNKFFAPTSKPKERYEILEWVEWQMGGVGPMFGQFNHFNSRDQKDEYAIERYKNESLRLITILDSKLEGKEWVAAGEYTIADMVLYPWIHAIIPKLGNEAATFANVKRWDDKISARPAVQKAQKVCRIDALPDANAFGTFKKPEGWEAISIYDVKKQRELLAKK